MRLHHFKLRRETLESVPDAERTLLVLLGHAANELSVLTKLFHFCATPADEAEVLMQARNAQALVLGRLLTGKIYECWQLLQSAYFGSQVSRTYAPLLDPAPSAAIDSLGRYFGRDNVIERVRNRFAFHYSPDQVPLGFAKLIDGDSLDIYLSETNANTLYSFAESVTGRALMESIDPADHSRSVGTLIDETTDAIGWLNEAIAGIFTTCFRRHIGGNIYELGAKPLDIEGAPDWKSVAIPYFVEIAEAGGDA